MPVTSRAHLGHPPGSCRDVSHQWLERGFGRGAAVAVAARREPRAGQRRGSHASHGAGGFLLTAGHHRERVVRDGVQSGSQGQRTGVRAEASRNLQHEPRRARGSRGRGTFVKATYCTRRFRRTRTPPSFPLPTLPTFFSSLTDNRLLTFHVPSSPPPPGARFGGHGQQIRHQVLRLLSGGWQA